MRSIARFPCGRWTKWAVLAAWLVVFVVAGPLAGKLTGIEKNDPADALPKDAESTRVVDLAKQFTPSDTVPALVVYERGGAASAADRAKVAGDVRRFAGIDNVGGRVVGPIPAKDGAAFQVVVPIRAGDKGSEAIVSAVEEIRAIARDGEGTSGLRVYVTGPAGYEAAFGDVFEGIDSSLLSITAAIVIVILLLTYRSPVLWLLPLVCVIVALTAAQAVIYLLAGHAGLVVNDLSATTLTVLVFGAGTDYALLLMARYREELRRNADRHEAMAEALHRAGPAIIASASTVALSLLCFLVAELSSSKSVGAGDGDRHRSGARGHAHPAAGAAGGVRPLGVLAGPADPGLAGADRARRVGAHRRRRGPPSAAGVAGDGRGPRGRGVRHDRAQDQRPAAQGLVPHQARGGDRGAGARPPLPGRDRQPGPGDRPGRGSPAAPGRPGGNPRGHRRQRAGDPRWLQLPRGHAHQQPR